MAVLKSPRNSRKKNIWASSYLKTSRHLNSKITNQKNIKISHKFHLFLQESTYWTHNVKDSHLQELPEPVNSPTLLPRPNQFLVYGRKRFDSTLTSPLLLRQHLRSSSNKKRFFHLINSYKV